MFTIAEGFPTNDTHIDRIGFASFCVRFLLAVWMGMVQIIDSHICGGFTVELKQINDGQILKCGNISL